MMALISPVTYACPAWILAGGCSLTVLSGTIHATSGKLPALAAFRNWSTGLILPNWLSCLTVSKAGSGFQMPGWLAFSSKTARHRKRHVLQKNRSGKQILCHLFSRRHWRIGPHEVLTSAEHPHEEAHHPGAHPTPTLAGVTGPGLVLFL